MLILENPGLRGSSQITSTLYAGLQLIMPGEVAPAHRHTQSALRFIVEGQRRLHRGRRREDDDGAGRLRHHAVVDLAPPRPRRPAGRWSGSTASTSRCWRTSTARSAKTTRPTKRRSRGPTGDALARYGSGLLPVGYRAGSLNSPVFNYPYARTREALQALTRAGAPDPHVGHLMRYVNPVDGGWAMPTMATMIRLLPRRLRDAAYRSSDSTVFVVVEGSGQLEVGGERFDLAPHDIAVVPGWMPYTLHAGDGPGAVLVSRTASRRRSSGSSANSGSELSAMMRASPRSAWSAPRRSILRHPTLLETRMQLKKTLVLAALALGAVQAFGADVVKIGLVLPMSGPFASYGKHIDNGVRLYLAQNGDTFGGKKIELITKDDAPGTAGDVSKRLAQELVVQNKVDILAGFGLTPSALAVAPVATEAKKPMVVMNAATSIITAKSPYIVRTSHTLPQDTAPIATWAAKNGIKKVYTLVADYGPGHDAEAQFKKSFTAAGGQIIGEVRVPVTQPRVRAVPAEDQGQQARRGVPVHPAGRRGDRLHEGLRRPRADSRPASRSSRPAT